MKRLLLIFVALSVLTVGFAQETKPGGASVQFGYLFTTLDAAIHTADSLGIDTKNTNMLHLDINGWTVLNRYLRLGGILSGGYFDVKGTPDQTVMGEKEAGVGFGDARVAFLPEAQMTFGPVNFSGGLAIGGGAIIPFIKDDHGDNDGDLFFYSFMRPQVSASYDLGPIGVMLTSGFHLPIAGDKGEFWFIHQESADTVRHKFETTEVKGLFVELGLFFGARGIRNGSDR